MLPIPEIRHHARQLVREFNLLNDAVIDTGYNFTQCHVLFELQQHKTLNVNELSDLLRIDKSTVSRVVKSLIDDGLIIAKKNDRDQRQKLLELTAKGQKATDRNNGLADAQVKSALALMNQQEQQTVMDGLALYAKALYRSRVQADYLLRPILPADNTAVARLIQDTMCEFACVGEGYSINDPEVANMYEAYKGDRSVFYVIEKQGEILGCGGIGPLEGGEKTTCELRKMYFRSELRGLGLGQRLLQTCLDDAKNLGYTICYLETVERMWHANKLYQKMGFQRLEQAMGATGHGGCEVFYAKELIPVN